MSGETSRAKAANVGAGVGADVAAEAPAETSADAAAGGLPDLPDAERFLLEFEDVRLGGYAWWCEGEAPAVLLLHGWGEDASVMAPVARQVREHGLHAVSLSLRGWPGSTGRDDYGISAPKDVGRVLDWVRGRAGASGVVLLGFSMGGVMGALASAAQEPGSLLGFVSVSAPCDLRDFYRDTAYGGVRRYFDATLQEHQWVGCSPITHAERLGHPMLIALGTEDTMTPPGHGRRMAEAVADAELMEFEGMSHVPDESQWEQILDRMVERLG